MCRSCILTIHKDEQIKQDQTDGNMGDVLGEEKYVQGLVRDLDRRRPL